MNCKCIIITITIIIITIIVLTNYYCCINYTKSIWYKRKKASIGLQIKM